MSKHQWWCRNPPLSPLGPSRTASQRGRKMSKVSDLAETPFPEHTEKGGPGARNFTPQFVHFPYVFRRPQLRSLLFSLCILILKLL